MDHSLLRSLNGYLFHHDGVEDAVLAYVNAAEALFLGALVLAFLLALGRGRDGVRRAVVAAGLGAGAALALAQVLSRLVDRDRPFVADPRHVHLFAHHAADPGFPSDHATAAFAIAVALLLRHRGAGIAALVAATVLAAGRVAVGVHYPTDVLGGAVLGALTALALWAVPARRVLARTADLAGRLYEAVLRACGVRLPERACDSAPA
jgi:undecaprenyl-diphosphatase